MTGVELLGGLSPEERRRVLSGARARRFAAREVLFHEGDPGDCFHLVASGRVAVRVHTLLGEVATLAVLGPGETVGELAVLGDGRRTATVAALERTETWSFRTEALDELRRTCPAVDQFLVETLAATIRRLSGLLVDAMYAPADRRVLRRLADLECRYAPTPTPDAHPIRTPPTTIALTQEELATMAGTSRATVNQVLRAGRAQGYLRLARGRIVVADWERLRREAGL